MIERSVWLALACTLACTKGDTPAAPAQSASADHPLVIFITAGGEVPVAVEIAREPDTRARGLMHRKSLDPMGGMLFVFANEAEHSFWMKNTLIPLDMIFINARFEVVSVVANAEPLTETPRSAGVPSTYVVEVNGGFARRFGITTDTRVQMQGVLRSATR